MKIFTQEELDSLLEAITSNLSKEIKEKLGVK